MHDDQGTKLFVINYSKADEVLCCAVGLSLTVGIITSDDILNLEHRHLDGVVQLRIEAANREGNECVAKGRCSIKPADAYRF